MSTLPLVEQTQRRLLDEVAAGCALPSLAMTASHLQEGA